MDKLLDGWTLNLAFYELGKAVWKQFYVRKTITVDEANKLLDPKQKSSENYRNRRRVRNIENSCKGEPNLL